MTEFLSDANFQALTGGSNDTNVELMTVDLMSELMHHFYTRGWMAGSGGAMGCLTGNSLMISPSALQKERLTGNDMFVYNTKEKTLVSRPKQQSVTISSCAPLFTHIISATGATCIIHTHSHYSNLLTQMEKSATFQISHQEYIKAVHDPFTRKNLSYEDTLVIPIIENQHSERLLLPGLEAAMLDYPQSVAVLVRHHGLFVWGNTWQETKIQLEGIEYLLELAVNMKKLGLPLVQDEAATAPRSGSDYQISFTE